MAEESTLSPEGMDGQVDETPTAEGTTDSTPETTEGQVSEQHTQKETSGQVEDTFFDPKSIEGKPELEAAYKQMQGAFTKRMQGISKEKQKLDAYDNFMNDPIGNLQRMAKQYGYRLDQSDANTQTESNGQNKEPQTWDDVYNAAEKRIMEKLQPMFKQFNDLKKSNIESQLSEIDPTWQQYEDDMITMLSKHPTLRDDPATLYRMSVPSEVLESRAMQKALKKFEDKAQSSKIAGPSTTTKQPEEGLPDKPISFQDAVKFAEAKLAKEGIRPPPGFR